jgi:hypothetical protein
VWKRFKSWLDLYLQPDDDGVLVAWNGEKCDLTWLWQLTQAPRSTLSFPPQLKYFLDPLKVIGEYSRCPLHKSKSKLESLKLGCVWKFISGDNLNGAHNSLVDVQAQTDIVTSKYFIDFIDLSKSIRSINDIFTTTEQREMTKQLEPSRPVHKPWQEFDPENDIHWEPKESDKYTGASGGAKEGPTLGADVAAVIGLSQLFFYILPLPLFTYVADATKKYAYHDWVVPKDRLDRDGNTTVRPILSPITVGEGETLPPIARHRPDKSPVSPSITCYFILAWLSIVILAGAYAGGNNNRFIRNVYRNSPYGICIPFIQNAMTEHNFTFVRRFLHFADNDKHIRRGDEGYDILFKVRYVLDLIMKRLGHAWNAGERVTIDESMICYNG